MKEFIKDNLYKLAIINVTGIFISVFLSIWVGLFYLKLLLTFVSVHFLLIFLKENL